MAAYNIHIPRYQYLFINLIAALFLIQSRMIYSSIFTKIPTLISSLLNSFCTIFFPISLFIIAIFLTRYIMSRPGPVYLIDFTCYRPPESYFFPFKKFMHHSHNVANFKASSVNFQEKIVLRSGLGDDTALPASHHVIPYEPTMAGSRNESELVVFTILDSLFRKTRVNPKDVDILVVNCSLFSPTPSLSAMIVNKYQMRYNIRSYNLGGMGCSAGLISIDLARNQLHAHPNSTALVITTEIITEHWYTGNKPSMLLANCLFRMGGAAILLSNKRVDADRSKYQLAHIVRTNHSSYDEAYHCAFQEEDDERKLGISLSKDLTAIAGKVLKENITTIAPKVLPVSELFKLIIGYIKKKPYMPDFRKAFEHFCIHAGGRAVIDELSMRLKLSKEQAEPSKMTLYRFGNTSSSSPWYELSYIESKGRMKKGDRVWQVGLGSGFKCHSAVWKCKRQVKIAQDSPWADCIDKYPVQVPGVSI